MRKIYLVKEFSIISGKRDMDCGIVYYSSKKKAINDLNNRAMDLNIQEIEGGDLIAERKYNSNYSTYYKMEIHDLY